MSESVMSKDPLLQEFVAAYERLIATALRAAQRGAIHSDEIWGPREVVAHLAGWEIMANVRIPHIVTGMPPAEFTDETQGRVMNDAINATSVRMAGDQPLETLCGLLRQAYGRTVEFLGPLDDSYFQPGEYVYERTRSVIEHCQEHIDAHLANDLC
jgi:hypothetical protein